MSRELDLADLTRPGGIVPVDIETTAALVRHVLRLRAERDELFRTNGELANTLGADALRLRAALQDMFALVDEGWLVRNTENDAAPDWGMRQLGFVRRLQKAQAALNIQKEPK